MADPLVVVERAIPIAVRTYKLLEKSGAIQNIKEWFLENQSFPVIVVGVSGVGKTSFLNALTGISKRIPLSQRTRKRHQTKGRLGQTHFTFVDTPGEFGDHEQIRAIKEITRKTKFGVINVVANGYHETTAKSELAGTPSLLKIDSPVANPDFLDLMRKEEATAVEDWRHLLGKTGSASWFLTVVNKADLWWRPTGSGQPGLRAYEPGSSSLYADALGRVTCANRTQPYSTQSEPFYEHAPGTGYYGQKIRNEHHDSLVDLILEFTLSALDKKD